MNRRFNLLPYRTYATEANAIKAVEKKGFDTLRHFIAVDKETGRFFPVFVGHKALDHGVHFHFNIVG